MNSDLLKEAIADAKAVRATALANAKVALEEAFAPRFHAMFAEKLKEEAEQQEESTVTEVEAANNVSKAVSTKDVSKGQPKKMHSGKSFKPVQAGSGPDGVGKLNQPVCEVEEAAEVDENVEEAQVTSEDLDEIIRELEAEVADDAEGELPNVDGAVQGGEEPHIDVPMDAAAAAPVAPCPCPAPVAPEAPVADMGGVPPVAPGAEQVPNDQGDEEINLEELIASLNEVDDEDEKHEKKDEDDEMCENKENGMPAPDKGQAKDSSTMPKAKEGSKNHGGCIEKTHKIHETEDSPLAKENSELKASLQEHIETVEFLRGQINEVNLLNAKLLYTNKLFKEFAGVLNDKNRMKIVEHFDLTKTVREVKLAYALLAESLNFGVKAPKADAPKVVKTPSVVKTITEGLASKPVASTAPSKDIINESANMASRFKKLAGIKDTPTKK